jgi:hypothetical protein
MAAVQQSPQHLNIHEQIRATLDTYRQQHKIPNIVFHGPAGSGKKTLVREFIRAIYDNNRPCLDAYVMYVNCAEGKGIRFIREDLKTFAKTNIIVESPAQYHKTIVLLHADKLTNDAQSALRCCIEHHSARTRFFMIVENKYNLLRPILSRLCEIHVPLPMIAISGINGVELKPVNLYKYQIEAETAPGAAKAATKRLYGFRCNIIDRLAEWRGATSAARELEIMDFCRDAYERGYSALDMIHIIDTYTPLIPDMMRRYDLLLDFHKIKAEIRHEPLLMYYILLWLLV